MFTARRPRLKPNCTWPAASANSVSSPPRPTLSPGWKWVPRWRTMISPALTSWPPKRFTPSRWAFESRPFRVDDAPFLCAISQNSRNSGLVDASDLHLGVPLAVTLALLVTGLVLVLQNPDLRTLGLAEDLGGDREPARLGGHVAVVDDEHRRQRNRGTDLAGDLVHLEDVTDGDLLLPAAATNDRVHRGTLLLPTCSLDAAPRIRLWSPKLDRRTG